MGTFLVFIAKLLSCCGISIVEEEIHEPPKDASQSISDSHLIDVSHTRSDIDGPNNSHLIDETKKMTKASYFSDSLVKEVISAESSSACSQKISLQPRSEINYHDDDCDGSLKEMLTCQLETIIEPASVKLKNKKKASKKQPKAARISSLNNQNELLNGIPSTGSHSDSHSSKSITAISINAINQLPGSSADGYTPPEAESLPHILGSQKTPLVPQKVIPDYTNLQEILLVGEGDFSFSLCLAEAFGSAKNMVATSLNSQAYLKSHYNDAMGNIRKLRIRGCKVLHEVDATAMANDMRIVGLSFDRIIYNFPHCGDFNKSEDALRKNQSLIRSFMENSLKLIKEDGEIHIRHKSCYFFQKWKVRLLGFEAGLKFFEETCFDVSKFEGYNPKYGYEDVKSGSDGNFDVHPSLTYKFALHQHVRNMRRQNRKLNGLKKDTV